ncbi:MAG: PSD1 and planctomycete cytochrome C domain-containing protein [Planctomycetaceae bacterium]
MTRPVFYLCAAWVLSAAPGLQADERADFFESKVRPLLVENCVQCHGPETQESDIRLDSRVQVLAGSASSSPLVQPGNTDGSRLLQVIAWPDEDVRMPPDQKLSDDQIAILTRWVQDGAIWPEASEFGSAAATGNWQQHWAFQPIRRPSVPAVNTTTGDAHPVDAFIDQRLRDVNLNRSEPAQARTLVRRLSFAIVGLPPNPEDLAAADLLDIAVVAEPTSAKQRDEWLDEFTDRLLASPQFGERWGRYWLDVARYSDTKGYVFTQDREYANAWQFREWVIRSLNADMPYDEFLIRQIAADTFPDEQTAENLAAMGFLTRGRRFLNNKHDIIDDRIDLVARGTMGLTVACARCHDHKYDPVPQTDYYALYGVFDSSDEPGGEPWPLRLVDRDQPREPVVFLRGSPGNRGPQVTRHFLTALSAGEPEPFQQGSGRRELAEKIASPDNPLTARVAVNRIWMHLFGRGLVDSPSDFGLRSDPPSHPELLDYLAGYFIDHGWSRKTVIRHIMISGTYRQSSDRRPDAAAVDAENRLLARMDRRRLDFEAHRDAVLATSGQLDASIGGPSVDITTQPFPKRRAVYSRIDRQNLPGVFRTFDLASPDTHAPRRFETTVPQQALFQLNNPFMMEQADAIAARLQSADITDSKARVSALFRIVLQREPTAEETSAALDFAGTSADTGDSAIWSQLAQALLMTNEFMFVN